MVMEKPKSSPDRGNAFASAVETLFFTIRVVPESSSIEKVVSCTLANLFARESNETRSRINDILLKLYKETTLFGRLGGGILDKDLIEKELQILNAFCNCYNDVILRQILWNNRLSVGNLNQLLAHKNPDISSLAKEKLQDIFKIVKRYILEKNVSEEQWGTRSFYVLSLRSVEGELKRFHYRVDPRTREEVIKQTKEKAANDRRSHQKALLEILSNNGIQEKVRYRQKVSC